MDAKIEAVMGTIYLSIAGFSHFAQELFPVITFIAAATGAILGCHGVYVLVKNWLNGKSTEIHRPHFHGE